MNEVNELVFIHKESAGIANNYPLCSYKIWCPNWK